MHTCSDKVEAIVKAPTPASVTQLKSVLGLINYYGKFVKNLSSILQPLYNLLRKDVKWAWSQECEAAYSKIKKTMSSAPILIHFDQTKEVRLTCDASEYGIGAMISHILEDNSEQPIAFASRTLNDAEKQYSQIEKEGLAIIFGLNKFNQYLYGNKFKLVTDHKPLVTIFHPQKGIPQFSANRLRRWALILSNYNYSIEYIKSKDNKADVLSRLPMLNVESLSSWEIDNADYMNYFRNDDIPINHDLIQSETKKDKDLLAVMKYVRSGWPNFSKVPQKCKQFYHYRSELTIQDDCLLLNHRIIIPLSLRKDVLQELHKTHLGIVKMKSYARSYFWWPNLSKNVEILAQNCEAC